MGKKHNKVYPPHLRNFFEQDLTIIKGYSQKDYTKLPDPVRDPMVSNNISSQEFNYTYNEEEDIGYNSDYLDEE
ncbi:MAG: hypothetical protein H7Y18_19320 [Clostridiaceae bacterium]|nr:hypothetical protein [Clostridiaceae bacterium]